MSWIIVILSVQGFCLYSNQLIMIEIGAHFKASEKIPSIGRYKCLVCGLIIDIQQKFIDMGSSFFSCPICHAGTDGGPRSSVEDVREFLG